MRKLHLREGGARGEERLEFLPDDTGLCWEKAVQIIEEHMGKEFSGLITELAEEKLAGEGEEAFARGYDEGVARYTGKLKKYMAKLEKECGGA